ncbi:MAG: AraC family transcriptional regulator, partial [Bradyrhizobium sp.]
MTAHAAADRSSGLSAAQRLAAYGRVATHDVDEAAEQIGRIFCPHGLQPRTKSAHDFLALHNCAAFDGFSINYVAYGGAVTIDPGCLDRFFLVQLPLAGTARIFT